MTRIHVARTEPVTVEEGENKTMRAVFVRHGQSTGNAGVPCDDLSKIELTDLGVEQARVIAAWWPEKPDLVVTSPYIRTQQTASPTMIRYPNVPVEVWPIQEFTYLQPSRWNGTLSTERLPYIERYWENADPDYCDGQGAESFNGLIERARATIERLEKLPEDALVYVFSHGQFIQAVRTIVTRKDLSELPMMRNFWRKGERDQIRNAELVRFVQLTGKNLGYCGFVRPTEPRSTQSEKGLLPTDTQRRASPD